MNFRQRFKNRLTKELSNSKVTLPTESVESAVRLAFFNVTGTRVSFGSLETSGDSYAKNVPSTILMDAAPEIIADVTTFVASCIDSEIVDFAKKDIESENKTRRGCNRIKDITLRFLEDYDRKVQKVYESYVEKLATEYAKRDAEKIFKMASEHYVKHT